MANYQFTFDSLERGSTLQPGDREIIERNSAALGEYAEFCAKVEAPKLTEQELEYLGADPFEETHFGDLSLGFFLARSTSWMDAFRLSSLCRYTLRGFL